VGRHRGAGGAGEEVGGLVVSAVTPDDIKDLRRTIKADRESRDKNTVAVEELTVELRKFNENVGDLINVGEQLMPLAEGAAMGSTALQMVLPAIKSMLAKRKERRAQK